jgi:hypothetical protein
MALGDIGFWVNGLLLVLLSVGEAGETMVEEEILPADRWTWGVL